MYLHSLRACPQDRLLTRLKQYNNRVLVSCKLSSHFPPFCQKLFLCNCTSPQNFSNVHKSSLATMLTYFERYGSETLHSFFQRSWAKETAHTAMTLLIYLLISGLNSFVRLFVFFFFLHFFFLSNWVLMAFSLHWLDSWQMVFLTSSAKHYFP